MPRNMVAARRYAHAFFGLSDKPKEVLSELKVFSGVIEADHELCAFFTSPIISHGEKLNALADLKAKLKTSIPFLEALIEADRMDTLSGVVEEFSRICDEKSGELSVEIESAAKLSDTDLGEIENLLHEKWKRKLKLQTKISPELIGGFIARAPGKLLDASVASQLENLEEQIFS